MSAATLTREAVRQRIEQLEALSDVMSAIDDVSGVEFDEGEQRTLDLRVNAHGGNNSPVAFAHALPPDVLLAGLQAMRGALEARAA